MKELKGNRARVPAGMVLVPWNPVKELKATQSRSEPKKLKSQWNPVKELKDYTVTLGGGDLDPLRGIR